MKYTKGDRYRVLSEFGCVAVSVGDILIINKSHSQYPHYSNLKDNNKCFGHSTLFDSNTRKITEENEMESLKIGDILVCPSSYGPDSECTVEQVQGRLVFTIDNDENQTATVYSAKELQDLGYKLKTEEKVTELTLEQVAEKLKIPVNELRIKEK